MGLRNLIRSVVGVATAAAAVAAAPILEVVDGGRGPSIQRKPKTRSRRYAKNIVRNRIARRSRKINRRCAR